MSTDRRAAALCVARFYGDLAARLEEGARDALADAGIDAIDCYDVPGSFELPLIAKYAAESRRYEVVIALGAVIRGETDHYDYVCSQAASGIQQVSLSTGVPVGFGVLTVESMEQALARVKGGSKRDSARHAVDAALAAAAVRREIGGRRSRAGFTAS